MANTDFPNLGYGGQIEYLAMADGTRIRTAYWPTKENSAGIIVFVNGHREFMEKYTEFFSEILARNYALYALDNRGQGLSDRLLDERLKSHIESFDVFSNDLNEFISKKVISDCRAQEIPIYLVAHSMGGHICLRYLHDFPGVVSKAVIMAPMIEFNLGYGVIAAVLKYLIRFASRKGFAEKFAFGQKNPPSRSHSSIKQKFLTHDDQRYALEEKIIKSFPDLYVGGATYGWLNAALDSIETIETPGYLDEITIPILTVLAGKDTVVNSKTSLELLSGRKNFKVITIDGARHEIYREIDQYREQLWQEIDDFLAVE
ncbi:Lysophospholipase L2 [hydrothermal vent metagenome]|uniref:Lysophospholipase L2 n=1 Tax=hydrothermal vent metagenome TaxID=652676 RepID=A0A3B0RRB3_9ZZZZ